MNRNFLTVAVISILLAACGQSGGDGGQPGGPEPSACRQTIDGHITAPLTLTSDGTDRCDYFVAGHDSAADRIVNVTSDLVIEPGTIVLFGQNVRLSVTDTGSITAVGTAADPIVLAGAVQAHGSWYGICFSRNRESRFDHVQMLWGGNVWTGGSAVCNGAISGVSGQGEEPVHITNSLIYGSRTAGLSAHGMRLGDFHDNVLANNLSFGARVSTGNLSRLGPGDYLGESVGEPNGRPYIHVSKAHAEARGKEVWLNHNAAYLIDRSDVAFNGPFVIDEGVEVHIEPGTTFVMDSGMGRGSLMVLDGASLHAVGTAEDPITFRGAEATPGYWDDIYFSRSAGSTLEHVVIEWAGGSPDGLRPGSIYVYRPGGTGEIALHSVTVRGSSTCAIWVSDSGAQGVSVMDLAAPEHNDDFPVLCGPFEPAP